MRPSRPSAGLTALLPLLAGCSGWQSALDPKGPAADELARLIWFFTLLCAVVWLLVMIVLAMALLRRKRQHGEPLLVDAAADRRPVAVVSLRSASPSSSSSA